MGKHQLEILQVHLSIATIPLFGIDVPLSSQGVGLSTKLTRAKSNGQIELRKILRPPGLLTGENLRGEEALEIFVVSDDVDRSGGALKIMAP